MSHAEYMLLDADGGYCGEIPRLDGLWPEVYGRLRAPWFVGAAAAS